MKPVYVVLLYKLSTCRSKCVKPKLMTSEGPSISCQAIQGTVANHSSSACHTQCDHNISVASLVRILSVTTYVLNESQATTGMLLFHHTHHFILSFPPHKGMGEFNIGRRPYAHCAVIPKPKCLAMLHSFSKHGRLIPDSQTYLIHVVFDTYKL